MQNFGMTTFKSHIFKMSINLCDICKWQHIELQGRPPIKQRYRVVSPKVQEAMYQKVDRILAEVVIKESFSE